MFEFLIFFAPFLVVIVALVAAFYVAPKDNKSER
ncbi:cytochrome bd oxidase small subunit CydS [Solibacillus daqui]